jgi:hypothetical protein
LLSSAGVNRIEAHASPWGCDDHPHLLRGVVMSCMSAVPPKTDIGSLLHVR